MYVANVLFVVYVKLAIPLLLVIAVPILLLSIVKLIFPPAIILFESSVNTAVKVTVVPPITTIVEFSR